MSFSLNMNMRATTTPGDLQALFVAPNISPPYFININGFMFHRQLMSQPHVIWIDNFSKSYAVAMQSIDKGAYSSCLWTGKAMKLYNGPTVDVIRTQEAMPGNLLTFELMSDVSGRLIDLTEHGWFYSSGSVVQRYKVTSVPLKPVVDYKTETKLHQTLAESPDGVKHFHPLGILEDNVSSNRGLLAILKDMDQKHRRAMAKQDAADNYTFMSVDCNIFLRVAQVTNRFH